MANIGTQINSVIVAQGFNYAEFDSVDRAGTATGLRFMARFEKPENGWGRRCVHVNVDRNADSTYRISFGLGKSHTIADSVTEDRLGDTLTVILRKEAIIA